MTLILDMPCQDDSATVAVDDVSASNNDGTLSGSNTHAITTSGPGGTLTKAFDGSVLTPGSLAIGTGITIASNGAACIQFFANIGTTGTNMLCGDAGTGSSSSSIDVFSTMDIVISLDDGSAVTRLHGTTVTNWHHYAIVFNTDGSTTLYVDGLLVGNFDAPRGDSFVLDTFTRDFNLGESFLGKFCGLRIYDTTRTQPQILADAQVGGLGISEGGGGSSYVSVLDSLVAYYPMDDNAANQVVRSTVGTGLNGVYNRAGVTTADRSVATTIANLPRGLTFDGDFDYVTAPAMAGPRATGQLTLAGWIYFNTLDSRQDFLCWKNAAGDRDISLYGDTVSEDDTRVVLYQNLSGTSGIVASSFLDSATWTHVTITSNGSVWKMYQNGLLLETAAVTADFTTHNSNVLWFGSNHDGSFVPLPSFNLWGIMMGWGVWSRVLTAPEITSLYNDGDGLNPVGYRPAPRLPFNGLGLTI